ncbi:hypothetical protein FV226_04110 [Methylobacterium sp. WL12]|uniref:LPS translocon maturation chaperone LptM n=1 Tax=Methylobacterium sp. WL12 TaxID=2603890 RepID=UPI0011C76816|nr:lipoprotein [Methylobacterium sp. WL12]TXM75178.1 hypothetical protein FV226_04110 [Methylobacterium sp. WL12]
MPPSRVLTSILAAALVALALAGCGRRGALEPPGASATVPARNTAQGTPTTTAGPRTLPVSAGLGGGAPEPDPLAVRAGDELPPSALAPASGTEAPVETSRGAKRGYRIPKDPFILDPLL